MKNNIILIGFMGCGKTSTGIRLSYALRRTLIDTDKWIEKKQKMSISELFASKGEACFRKMETDCIRELIRTEDNRIIATGGGLPLRKENARLLAELGSIYYLRITPEIVYERLKYDTTRPLLQGEDPKGKIRALLEQRAPLYEACADHVIDVGEKNFGEIIDEICRLQGEERWNGKDREEK